MLSIRYITPANMLQREPYGLWPIIEPCRIEFCISRYVMRVKTAMASDRHALSIASEMCTISIRNPLRMSTLG